MRSMTGYGRGNHSSESGCVVVEIRSVNRRQIEISLRLPHQFEALESRIREVLGREVARGRLDITVDFEPSGSSVRANLNRPLAMAYARALASLAKDLDLAGPVTLDQLLRCPGVIQASEP